MHRPVRTSKPLSVLRQDYPARNLGETHYRLGDGLYYSSFDVQPAMECLKLSNHNSHGGV